MLIKDLSLELDAKALTAVRGGNVTGTNVGAILMGPVSQSGGSGLSFGSPVTNANVQAPTLSQTNVGFDNDISQRFTTINDNDVATLVGSAVGRFRM